MRIKPHMLALKCILTDAHGEHMPGINVLNAESQAQLVVYLSK